MLSMVINILLNDFVWLIWIWCERICDC